MKQYLYDYIEYIDKIIEEGRVSNQLLNEHLVKINFFQHERIIHLFVTLTYALLFFIVTIPVSLRLATECYYTGYDSMGNEIWLKHIEKDIYEDVKGNRYKMN